MAARQHDLNEGLGAQNDRQGDTSSARLKITLVSDEPYQLACLQGDMRAAGVSAELSLKKPGHATAQALRRRSLQKNGQELVLLDFTHDDVIARRMLKSIAFGEKRSRVAVAILTQPDTEQLLDSGEIDGGDATMFSPTRLDVMLNKLGGETAGATIRSISVLNEYGPVLIRANSDCECCNVSLESA